MYTLNYNVMTFCIIFYIYCFLGWCFESIYVSIKSKKWINRGFMKGPFLPIYGTGAVTILFVSIPVMSNPFFVYTVSFLAATVLELVTGIVMESLFKVKYWDYSGNFMNYKGYICIKSSITWGFMGLLVTYVINEPIAGFINSVSNIVLLVIAFSITLVFVFDFVSSFREAYSLRKMILNNEKLMKELNELKVNIAVAVGEASDKKNDVLAEIKGKIDTAISYTEIDDFILEKYNELKNLNIDESIELWREKTSALKSRLEDLDIKKFAILKRNPTASTRQGFEREMKAFFTRRKKTR